MELKTIKNPIRISVLPKELKSATKSKRQIVQINKNKTRNDQPFFYKKKTSIIKDSELLTIRHIPIHRMTHSISSSIISKFTKDISFGKKESSVSYTSRKRSRMSHVPKKSEAGLLSRIKVIKNKLLLLKLKRRVTIISRPSKNIKGLMTIRNCTKKSNTKHSGLFVSSEQTSIVTKSPSKYITPSTDFYRHNNVKAFVNEMSNNRSHRIVTTIKLPSAKYKGQRCDAWTSTEYDRII